MPDDARPIVGFEGYAVCPRGRVFHRLANGNVRELRPTLGCRGHLKVRLFRDGKVFRFFVHVLVLEAFVGPRPQGLVCRHLDGDKRNNRVDNLKWGTHAENWEDRRRHAGLIEQEFIRGEVFNGEEARHRRDREKSRT